MIRDWQGMHVTVPPRLAVTPRKISEYLGVLLHPLVKLVRQNRSWCLSDWTNIHSSEITLTCGVDSARLFSYIVEALQLHPVLGVKCR